MKSRWLAYAVALGALMMFGYACKKGGGDGATYLTVLQESRPWKVAPTSRSKPASAFRSTRRSTKTRSRTTPSS